MKRFVAFICFMIMTACAATPTLDGKWVINGPTPKPDSPNGGFVALDFHRGNTLTMTYRPDGFADLGATSKGVESHTVPYEDLGHGEIRVTLGGQAQDFRVQVKDALLYFTPIPASSGDSQADALMSSSAPTTVFRRPQ